MSEKRGTLIVVSGSSGVGKSTVISQMLENRKDIYFSISFTTRAPRPGEVDGVDYHFVDRVEFEERIARDEFLEHAEYVGNYYGTSMKVIEENLAQGIDVLLDIEVQGAAKVKQRCPEAVMIFILPPSFEELARRLRERRTDSPEKIAGRLEKARQECGQVPIYDYIVVNDEVSNAVDEILAILVAENCRTKKRLYLTEGL